MSEQFKVTLGILILTWYLLCFYSLHRKLSGQTEKQKITFRTALLVLVLVFVGLSIKKMIWGFPWGGVLIASPLVSAGVLGIGYFYMRKK